MAPVSHKLTPDRYCGRLMDLEASGLYAVGDLRGHVRQFEGDLPAIAVEEGYLPSADRSLNWLMGNHPFPLSPVALRVPYPTAQSFVEWMNAVVSEQKKLFDFLGITTALEIYAHNHIPRDHRNVIPLLSLWNRDSHTFVGKFHEFTITLLDVHVLLRLPLAGTGPLMIPDSDLSVEEKRVVSLLNDGGIQTVSRGRITPSSWVSHFRYKHLGDPVTHIASFLAIWLDQAVFPSSGKFRIRGISPHILSMAARLACGTRLALGAAFLGTLYWRLDQFSLDLHRSCGKFEVISLADVCLLQVLLWEYFPGSGPSYRNAQVFFFVMAICGLLADRSLACFGGAGKLCLLEFLRLKRV